MLTLERETFGGPQARLSLRCLITDLPADCLTRSPHWLERIHHRMEGAFQDVQQGHISPAGRK